MMTVKFKEFYTTQPESQKQEYQDLNPGHPTTIPKFPFLSILESE